MSGQTMRNVIIGLMAFLIGPISLAAQDPPAKLKVCLVSGSEEYHSDATLAAFQRDLEAKYNVACVLLKARGESELPGLESLDKCDVAVFFTRRLKIDGEDLPVAPIGTSAQLEAGQVAIAIGNPLGYENTVTTGVVSGLGRQITASDATQTSAETLNNLIQTDAAINPGNSGGPLVNSAGQVIGVNTAVSTTGQGLGFAIPIDVARPIMQQALDGQELTRPWIGVYYVPVDPALAAEQDLPVEYGALIGGGGGDAIFPGSPAEDAGLQAGDIVVSVNDEQLGADTDLATLILPHAPGDTITLRVLRDNSAREVQVTLGELPGK